MTLIINGEQQTAADDLSIADLLATFGYPDQGVAVAVDGEIAGEGRAFDFEARPSLLTVYGPGGVG